MLPLTMAASAPRRLRAKVHPMFNLDGTGQPVLNIFSDRFIAGELELFRAFSAPLCVPTCRHCTVLNMATTVRYVALRFARNRRCIARAEATPSVLPKEQGHSSRDYRGV